jgi:glycerate kinase
VRRSAIPTVVLVAPQRLGGDLPAAQAADAIVRGLRAAGWECDPCPLGETAVSLEAAGFDRRMRVARAVVTGGAALDRGRLTGTVLAEVATRARQGGVPCYAVVGRDATDRFDRRMLDLEAVVEARTVAALERAGAEIASML